MMVCKHILRGTVNSGNLDSDVAVSLLGNWILVIVHHMHFLRICSLVSLNFSDESLRGESRSGSQKVRVDAQSRRVFHIQTVGNGYIQTIAWSCHAAKMLNVLYSVDDTKLPGQWANLDSQGRGFDEESMQYHTATEHLLKNKFVIFEICFSPSH